MGSQGPALERVTETNNASLKDVIMNVKSSINYLKSKWLWIILFGFVGAIVGFLYSKMSKPVYTAECTFVLDEDNGKKGGGGLAALGLGVGGKSGDFFAATDNITWLYSTRLMIQKTLLTPIDSNGKKMLLINWFLSESKLDKEFAKNKKLSKIKFDLNTTDSMLTLGHNAIISRCANLLRTKYLKAEATPKTENVISVKFKSEDEALAALFTNELVKNVNDYYIQTKTKKASEEVALLERKAAEYKAQMSSNMYEVASGFDDAPYANPNRSVLKVEPQRKQVDAKISGEIYGGLVQQLELSRTNLQKQMPLIQIIEQPILPLPRTGINPIIAIIISSALCVFIAILWLIISMQVKKVLV